MLSGERWMREQMERSLACGGAVRCGLTRNDR